MAATLQGPFGLIALQTPSFTIGSAPDNQLVLQDLTASAHHAVIHMQGQNTNIVDLASANGTYVNEQLLEKNRPYSLNSGDCIRIGNTVFRYEVSWSPPLPADQERNSGSLAQPLGYTDYGQLQGKQFSGYTPPPPPYDPDLANPYHPTWSTTEISDRNTPLPLVDLHHQDQQQKKSVPPPSKEKTITTQMKIVLGSVAALVAIALISGGTFVYLATRPQPFITVNSDYNSNLMPVGATSTELRVSGHKFSGSSSITFLLDGKSVPDNQVVQSDPDGSVTANLNVTKNWPVGNHMLTAQDANGNTTKDGIALKIVLQGQAHTPGPNGAPPDDATFSINATYLPNGRSSVPLKLEVMAKSDASGGLVCTSGADGSQYTQKGQDNIGTYSDTYTFTCRGSYKAGKLIFDDVLTSDTFNYTNGVICREHEPYVYTHLEGSFTSATSISGIYSRESDAYDCTQGASLSYLTQQGTWTGQLE